MTNSLEKKYEECILLCNSNSFDLALSGFEEIFSTKPENLSEIALRRTYVISSWILLGKYSYPPALDALSKVLKEKENTLHSGEDSPDLVKDIEAIKNCLNNLDCHI